MLYLFIQVQIIDGPWYNEFSSADGLLGFTESDSCRALDRRP